MAASRAANRLLSNKTICGSICSSYVNCSGHSNTLQSRNESTLSDAKVHVSSSYGPSVRLLLNLYDIRADQVAATGPHSRLLKGDVMHYISSNNLEPKPPAAVSVTQVDVHTPAAVKAAPQAARSAVVDLGIEFKDIELTGMRRTIAKRLTQSKTSIPHLYSSTDCVTTNLLAARKSLARDGIEVSVNDFVIKSCAMALQRMPDVNCIWNNGASERLSSVDISVAVATDTGLITPIVTSANEKSVSEISSKIKDLAERGRQGKLGPHEIQGGSFTVSNLGMFGIKEFTAVINPPQACILAVGSSQLALDDNSKPVTTMNLTLSCDRRIVDEVAAARFLSLLKSLIENPQSMGV